MVLVCNHHSVRSIAALVAALSYVVWWVWLYSAITAVYNLYIIVPLLSVYSTMDATITFSLTTTSCPQKVNKSCTSVVCLFNNGCWNGCCYHLFIDYYFLSPTRSISPVPLLSVYSKMDAAMDAASTFSLTTISCPHKVNKFCTSVVCLFNKGCCNRCCHHFFIDYYFLSPQGQ